MTSPSKSASATDDEDPTWRAVEREAEHLWKQAREAGVPAADLIAASKLGGAN
ncbi:MULTISPECIES: hypothetical protein [unclassified Streptomyces]|uniref:hypothetical protein n=1 Tax=unclassified Streptomyces TaxID=2593676 RepID=UPI0040412F05